MLRRKVRKVIPTVFFRGNGDPIKHFRKAWIAACEASGNKGRLLHDFRRTAARNFDRAGISRSVAMSQIGHKTEAIYRRYRIVDERDLRDAAALLNAYHAADAAKPKTTESTTGTVHAFRRGAR